MTAEEFAARVDKLIGDAEDEGLTWKDMAPELENLARLLREQNRERP